MAVVSARIRAVLPLKTAGQTQLRAASKTSPQVVGLA
jgi:hypothetical protein